MCDVHRMKQLADLAAEQGFTRIDAFSPFPSEELAEAVGVRRNWLPVIVLAGAQFDRASSRRAGFATEHQVVPSHTAAQRNRAFTARACAFYPSRMFG